MKRHTIILTTALILAACLAWGEPIHLLTRQEAALDDEPVRQFTPKAIPGNTGPAIKVVTPDVSREAIPPLRLDIRFQPQDGRRVDLARLKVECLKIITIDLTDRVKPYAKPTGIAMNEVNIPSGRHKLRVSIGDDQGGITQETFVVSVP